MLEIGINPNTQIPSIAIKMTGYFGIGNNGVKLVDSDIIFNEKAVKIMKRVPVNAFDTLQVTKINHGVYVERDEKGRVGAGNKLAVGNKGGRPSKTPITDRIKMILESKHYQKKDGTYVRADDLLAEAIVDQAVLRGNTKAIDLIMERVEGRVTQGVKMSGAIATVGINENDLMRLKKLFAPTAEYEQKA